MTKYYVGPGGNNGNDGLSWANRKLTLNGAEDIPVAAGDQVVVGPGLYREMLTLDVSGSGGSPIEYIADVTGRETDGIGGIVRVTGSDNDQTATRSNCFNGGTARNYRTFRGFCADFSSGSNYYNNGGTNWIIEDFVVQIVNGQTPIQIAAATQAACTIRRGIIYGHWNCPAIQFTHTATVSDCGHLVENVWISSGYGINSVRVGGITVKNCTIEAHRGGGVYVSTALAGGQVVTVNNCILWACFTGVSATATGELVEDYNAISFCQTARTNVATGSNSNAYPPIYQPPFLVQGVNIGLLPIQILQSAWSTIRALAGSSESTEDLFGITKPTTSAKKSWGAVQYDQAFRETGTVYAGAASLELSDAGFKQFVVPVTNVSTTISVRCYRETNYAGTNPRMVIKQPGQSDRTTTDTGSASTWNELTDTFTPAASPPYVIVELQSLNTATSGSYKAYFDSLSVN